MLSLHDLPSQVQIIVLDVASYIESPLDCCYPVSMTLARDLRRAGYRANVLKVHGYTGNTERLDPYWVAFIAMLKTKPSSLVHFLVQFDDKTIDLTFQQYDHAAPAVRIGAVSDLRLEWQTIEVIR